MVAAGRGHPVLGQQRRGPAGLTRPVEERPPAGRPVVLEVEIFLDGKIGRRAGVLPILRHPGDAQIDHAPLIGASHVEFVQLDRAGLELAQAGNRLGQFALAVAGHPRHPQDFPLMQIQRQVVDGGLAPIVLHPQAAQGQQFAALLHRWHGDVEENRTAHHHAHQFAVRDLSLGDGVHDPALAHDGYGFRQLHHFIQLVADEQEGAAGPGHAAHAVKEGVRLLRCQHGRGFVQDQETGAPVEHLDDLHPLPLSDRQLPDQGVRIDLESAFATQSGDGFADGRRIHAEAQSTIAQDHVFGDGLGFDQHEVLVHHAHAGSDCVQRGSEGDGPILHLHGSRVGPVQAAQDVHQR